MTLTYPQEGPCVDTAWLPALGAGPNPLLQALVFLNPLSQALVSSCLIRRCVVHIKATEKDDVIPLRELVRGRRLSGPAALAKCRVFFSIQGYLTYKKTHRPRTLP